MMYWHRIIKITIHYYWNYEKMEYFEDWNWLGQVMNKDVFLWTVWRNNAVLQTHPNLHQISKMFKNVYKNCTKNLFWANIRQRSEIWIIVRIVKSEKKERKYLYLKLISVLVKRQYSSISSQCKSFLKRLFQAKSKWVVRNF